MSKIKYAVSWFTLLTFLAATTSHAQEQTLSKEYADEGDYITVKEGDSVPYDGYLFDSGGLIKIMVNKSTEIQTLKIAHQTEITKLNIEIESLKKQYSLELKINKELSDTIIKSKQERITELENGNKLDDLKIFGALGLGIILSVTIFFAAVQIQK